MVEITKTHPKVSFIIPLYNGENFILRCIESISKQGLEDDDFEVIVVDNGSVDHGPEIVKSLELECNNIKLISEKRKGVCNARNTGINNICGEYFLLIDQDDILETGAIRQCVEVMDNTDADIMKFGIQFIEDNNAKFTPSGINYNDVLKKCNLVSGIDFLIGTQLAAMGHSQIGTCLIRSSFFFENQVFFNPALHYYEDQAFIIEMMLKAEKVLVYDAPFYYFFNHTDSTSHNSSVKAKKYIIDGILEWPIVIYSLLNEDKVRLNLELSKQIKEACHARCYGAIVKMISSAYHPMNTFRYVQRCRHYGIYPYKNISKSSCYYIKSFAHFIMWRLCKFTTMVVILASFSYVFRRKLKMNFRK